MSAEVLLIFLVAFLALALLGRASGRIETASRGDDEPPMMMSGHGRTLMRINEAIQIFQNNLDPAKLRRGN